MPRQPQFGDFPDSPGEPGQASIIVVPVPYDATSTWIKGADKGPAAIIAASANLEFYDIETESEVYRRGIFTETPVAGHADPEAMIGAVRDRVAGHVAEEKFVVVLGGEHSVSIGAIAAYAGRFGDLSVLQLDAHCDLRDQYNGSRFNHACVMARVKEVCPVVQVGIRSMDASERPAMDPDRGFFAKDIVGGRSWIDVAVALLSKRVYITIDLDVFDPSVMPSTGTPEPGGLLWYDVLALLRAVTERRDVVGFDVVELCPNKTNKAPDFTAAKLIYKVLSYRYAQTAGG